MGGYESKPVADPIVNRRQTSFSTNDEVRCYDPGYSNEQTRKVNNMSDAFVKAMMEEFLKNGTAKAIVAKYRENTDKHHVRSFISKYVRDVVLADNPSILDEPKYEEQRETIRQLITCKLIDSIPDMERRLELDSINN